MDKNISVKLSETSDQVLCGNCNSFVTTQHWIQNSLAFFRLEFLFCNQCKTNLEYKNILPTI